MKDFAVMIYPAREKMFLASYLHPLTKRRVREHFESKAEATAYKESTEQKFRRRDPSTYRELTVEDLLCLFISEQPQSDFAKAKMHIRDFTETFGKFQIEDLTTAALKSWLDEIQVENGLKDITMRGIKCSIDTFFRFLVRKEIIADSPLTIIFYKKPAPEIDARNILSRSQIDQLLASIKAYSPGYLYPIIKLFSETAIKPNEAVDLNWTQVNLESREIFFPQSDSARERTLKISDELAAILEMQKKNSGPVFMTYYREPFTKAKLTRLINEFKVMGTCKLKWTPMDLRHSFAVGFLENGGDMRALQALMGHNNVFDTKRLYGEVLSKKAQGEAKSPFEIGS